MRIFDLPSGLESIDGFGADPENVYVGALDEKSMGTLFKVPKRGGTSTKLATGMHNMAGAASSGKFVYFRADSGGAPYLHRVPVGGGAPSKLAKLDESSDTAITVDAWNVYFGTGDGISKLDDTNPSKVTVVVPKTDPTESVRSIAVCGDAVYWSTQSAIWRADAKTKRTKLADAKQALGVACDKSAVFWADRADLARGQGAIWSLANDATSPTALASGLDGPHGLAINYEFAYTTTNGGDKVIRASKDERRTVVLARGRKEPAFMLVDSDRLCWVDGNDGRGVTCALKPK
jgi:hypothetical protein